jgi:hypothetical protein
MNNRPKKPTVGDLVKISDDYPNTEAAGKIALIIKTLGIECVVEPLGNDLSESQSRHGKPWWFARRHLEVISASG